MHLSEITHPNQLHGLSLRQLEDIARQIREKHLQTIAATGGHLGPGLGVVELTIALYQTLDLDRDKVLWDVGHQAYPHKLLTGRYNDFHTLRQKNGIAGYLKRCESKFDHFGAGHASTSISVPVGKVRLFTSLAWDDRWMYSGGTVDRVFEFPDSSYEQHHVSSGDNHSVGLNGMNSKQMLHSKAPTIK